MSSTGCSGCESLFDTGATTFNMIGNNRGGVADCTAKPSISAEAVVHPKTTVRACVDPRWVSGMWVCTGLVKVKMTAINHDETAHPLPAYRLSNTVT